VGNGGCRTSTTGTSDRRHLLERDICHIDQVPTHLAPALNDKADLELHRIGQATT